MFRCTMNVLLKFQLLLMVTILGIITAYLFDDHISNDEPAGSSGQNSDDPQISRRAIITKSPCVSRKNVCTSDHESTGVRPSRLCCTGTKCECNYLGNDCRCH